MVVVTPAGVQRWVSALPPHRLGAIGMETYSQEKPFPGSPVD